MKLEIEFENEKLRIGVVSTMRFESQRDTESPDERLAERPSAEVEHQRTAVDALNALGSTLNPAITMHQKDVALFAIRIARALKLSEITVARIEMVAEVHDIGLNGIDLRIIDKSEVLTTYEYNILKLHSERGAAMLTATPALQHLAPLIRSHHERYDGKGYPDGLFAEEIPLESRILTVADAFHAMTTPQFWRPVVSPFIAVQELLREAEKQFDPLVVEALVRSFKIRSEASRTA